VQEGAELKALQNNEDGGDTLEAGYLFLSRS
jgi:hypothetical protein